MIASSAPDLEKFDEPAGWRAEAIRSLGLRGEQRMAAASPGAGFPAVLRGIATHLRLGPGSVLVDVGGGLGGACAWLVEGTGAVGVVVEPALGSVRGARQLFPHLLAAAGDGCALPVRSGAADAAVLLGVASLTPDLAGLLADVRRVLRPGGRLGLSDLCATGTTFAAGPNVLRSLDDLLALLGAGGFDVVDAGAGDPLLRTAWHQVSAAAGREVDRRHRHEARHAAVREDRRHVDRLLRSGRVLVGSLVGHRRP